MTISNVSDLVYKKWVNENCCSIFDGVPVYVTMLNNQSYDLSEYIDTVSCYWDVNVDNETMILYVHKDIKNCQFCKDKK